jgi:iron complex outermembrane receptor protein
VEPNVVLTHQNQNISATGGFHWTPVQALSVKGHVASAWRAPSVNEWYSAGVHHGASAFELGDLDLAPEKDINFSLSGKYTHRVFQLEVNYYEHYIQNYLYLRPQDSLILTTRGAFPFFKYQQRAAHFRGVDAEVSLFLGKKIRWNSQLSMVRARQRDTQAWLYGIPADRLKNSLSGQWGTSFFWKITQQWVAQQTRTELEAEIAPPPPAYQTWEIQLSKRFGLAKNRQLMCSFTCSNLLDVRFREYLNRFRYFADDMGRNLIWRMQYEF